MIKERLCVLISGRGSNLLSIIKSCREKDFPAKVKLIVSNKPKAPGLKYAKQYRIPFKVITKNFENTLLKQLQKNQIDILCLAGFMKVLSKNFIDSFFNMILNIHPSLLPKYKGLNTHRRALKNKEKFSGCTVHRVDKKLDSGDIILQSKVKITKNETEASLENKILKKEWALYPRAIKQYCKEIKRYYYKIGGTIWRNIN